MMRALVNDTLIYSITTLLAKLLSIGLTIFLARGLEKADFAVFDLAMVVGLMTSHVVGLQFSQGFCRLWSEADSAQERQQLFGTTLAWTLLTGTVILVVLLAFQGPLTRVFFSDPVYRPVLVGSAIYTLLLAISNFFRVYWRYKRSVILYNVSILVDISVSLAVSMVGILLMGQDVSFVFVALSLGALSSLLPILVDDRSDYQISLSAGASRDLARFSLPLLASVMLTDGYTFANRFFSQANVDLDEMALFSFAARFATVPTVLTLGLQIAITPLVYQRHGDPSTPGDLGRILGWVVMVYGAVLGITSAFATPLAILLGGADYAAAGAYLSLLTAAAIFQQAPVFAFGMLIHKRTDVQLYLVCASLVIMLGLLSAGAAVADVWGIAAGTMLASFLTGIAWFHVSDRFYALTLTWTRFTVACVLLLGLPLGGAWLDTTLADQPHFDAGALGLRALAGLTACGMIYALLCDLLRAKPAPIAT